MNDRKPFIIISAFTGKEDSSNTIKLENELKENMFRFAKSEGCYKGKTEDSFVVFGLTEEEAIKLAKKYNQESILSVSSCRNTWLIYQDGKEEYLGKFIHVNEHQAKSIGNYTKMGEEYYSVLNA